MSHRAALVAGSLALALTGLRPAVAGQEPPAAPAWRAFEGTWSATGRRQVVAIEGGAVAAIVEISGAVVLTSGEGLSRGFRGEAIGFDDGQGLSVGRAVWTDENGDRLFSRLKGEPLQTGQGPGRARSRAARAATRASKASSRSPGSTSFRRRTASIQGRAVGLKGRVRRAGAPR